MFNSNSRFYESADQVLGMKPSDYRARGQNTEIHFAVGECSLGAILVAQSQRGVCAILLGDDPGQLVRDLQDQFPKAELVGADQRFEQLVGQGRGALYKPTTDRQDTTFLPFGGLVFQLNDQVAFYGNYSRSFVPNASDTDTGQAFDPEEGRSYELGVNAFVVKPVDFKEFFDAIQGLGMFWGITNQPPPHRPNGSGQHNNA